MDKVEQKLDEAFEKIEEASHLLEEVKTRSDKQPNEKNEENEENKEEEEDLLLNDIWTFYFHDPYNEDWTYPSYQKVCDISSAEEFWLLDHYICEKVHCGMFFLMREYVYPCWDDENNIKGGCLSIKVLKQDVQEFWKDLCIKILGETFLKEEYNNINYWNMINGISTSPKKFFSIIKVWVKSAEVSDPKMFNFSPKYQGEIIYRSNQQNIDENHVKLDQKKLKEKITD